jgi:hypothetical protein
MPFSQWEFHLDVGDIVRQHIHTPHDLFFIHWHLKEVAINEEEFLTAIAEHPSAPQSHPNVEVVIDPLTGYLVEYHDGTELFTLLGETSVCAKPQTALASVKIILLPQAECAFSLWFHEWLLRMGDPLCIFNITDRAVPAHLRRGRVRDHAARAAGSRQSARG